MNNCKKIWYNLPKSIKDTLIWFDLPNQLNKLLEELKVEKPNCYLELYPNGHKPFIWYNLPTEVLKLCKIQICTIEQDGGGSSNDE